MAMKAPTILVVEDTPASSKLATMLLEIVDYAAWQADNAYCFGKGEVA